VANRRKQDRKINTSGTSVRPCGASSHRFDFTSLRRDWYLSNQAVPRAIRQTINGTRSYRFYGFPRQWIPLFEWFGVPWHESVRPLEYLPFFSELNEAHITAIVRRARASGRLRNLLETAAASDPIISDCLYRLDNTATAMSTDMVRDLRELEATGGSKHRLLLAGWQSYGRPSVRALEAAVAAVRPRATVAVVLPCAMRRPYDKSKTHRRLYRLLADNGHEVSEMHRIVISSLGVLPEEVWSTPQVLSYDAGVPDVYRLLRLARGYFSAKKYSSVFDCLQFEPYSDVLRIIAGEGAISNLVRLPLMRPAHFWLRVPRH
jgi:hypothetical protein